MQQEINQIKWLIKDLQSEDKILEKEIYVLKINKSLNNFQQNDAISCNESENEDTNPDNVLFDNRSNPFNNSENKRLNLINKINIQIWHSKIKLVVNDFELEVIALIDTGAGLNCIQKGLLPTKYFHKTGEQLTSANGSKMHIKYKLPKVHISLKNVCFKTSFVLVRNMTDKVILRTPFIFLLYPFTTSN